MTKLQEFVLGGLAGLSATMVMTAAMNRMERHLPADNKYPLPPREITERLLPAVPDHLQPTATLLAHFGYGAAAGAVYAATSARKTPGMLFGPLVWAASYWGWVPAAAILKPAHLHPMERNALMLTAHLVWGIALSASMRELARSARNGFASGPMRDAPRRNRMNRPQAAGRIGRHR